jgi:Zn-dependent metalloprotease
MRRTSRIIPVVLILVVALGVYLAARQGAGGAGLERVLAASGGSLRAWDDRVVSMERDRQMRLRAVQTDGLLPGRQHERLDQYYRGVRVVGGEVVRETDGKVTLSVTASVYSGIRVDTDPVLSPDDAVRAFLKETGATSAPRAAPELVILPRDDNTYVLAYRLSGAVRRHLPVMFVNAATGVVEMSYNNLQTQQPTALIGNGVLVPQGLVSSDQKKVACAVQSGTYQAWDMMRPMATKTYDLRGNYTRTDTLIEGRTTFSASDLATNTNSTWTDSVVVDAHTYIGWTYDYFYTRHGWKGLDGNNLKPVSTIVHPANRADITKLNWDDYADYFVNAFFCPRCGAASEDILLFGEGLPAGYILTSSGQYADYFVAAPDIVAHEYTHGVTSYTSNLVYRNESGALNEAFSDIMGLGMKFFQKQSGSGLLQADYLEAKETMRASRAGSSYGDRDAANPASKGDPDHYSKRYTGTSDNGGVHTNSTIASHAFYLAVEGGTNRTSGQTVTGVGAANRDKVEKVFFRGFTTLTSNATFSLARAKTIQEARTLYGTGSAVETAVTQAWSAVGVF